MKETVTMHRRQFLTGAGVTLTVPVAGCLSAFDGDEDSRGTADLAVRFWLEAVSLAESERTSIMPIVFEDISAGERDIVRTALTEGEYTVEPGSEPSALETLRDRIERRTGDGETLEVYLRRDDTHYRVGFADGDHIIAHPDQ